MPVAGTPPGSKIRLDPELPPSLQSSHASSLSFTITIIVLALTLNMPANGTAVIALPLHVHYPHDHPLFIPVLSVACRSSSRNHHRRPRFAPPAAFSSLESISRGKIARKLTFHLKNHISSSATPLSDSPSSTRSPVHRSLFVLNSLSPSSSGGFVLSPSVSSPSSPFSSISSPSLTPVSLSFSSSPPIFPSLLSLSSTLPPFSLSRQFPFMRKMASTAAENEKRVDEQGASVTPGPEVLGEVAKSGTDQNGGEEGMSKKAMKKAAKEAEKQAAKEAARLLKEQQEVEAKEILKKIAKNHEEDNFGYLPIINSAFQSSRQWTQICNLNKNLDGKDVWIRGRLQDCRGKGSLVFITLREQGLTLQLVLDVKNGLSKELLKWAASIPAESVVDVLGKVTIPQVEVQSTTQKVELQCKKLFCVSKAANELPFQLRDANLPADADGPDTKANSAIFRIQSGICQFFRQYLLSQNFMEIHSPKLIGGASEGGANCFTLDYFDTKACLAQSPQLYKQMVISGDFDRVFEIGPVFRAENSNTHRHLCEFTGLDLEMAFKEHYFEVVDVIDNLLKFIFENLDKKFQQEIQTVREHHPATPFRFRRETPRIHFKEGMDMLRGAGYTDQVPDDVTSFDISTELEKALGRLVAEKYDTDYYILYGYPVAVRPFYTMPSHDDPDISNSYDFFMRGEEILSGAQRIHDPNLLIQNCKKFGVPSESIKPYIDAFSFGAYPHAGAGIGLERVLMLYLGLNNIRKTALFTRDPKRLTP